MFVGNIKPIIEQISREKDIEAKILISAIEDAIETVARRKLGQDADIEVNYNEELGEVEVFQFKEVVEEITTPDLQISLEEGFKLDEGCLVGDSLGIKVNTDSFGRISAQVAKQIIVQRLHEAQKESIYTNYIERKGENVNGIVQQIERDNVIVNLGQVEAILLARDRLPQEKFKRGDRIKAVIKKISLYSRDYQIILSRTSPEFLANLFKVEVPEISEGIVNVVDVVREPGRKAKVAVSSLEQDIDPVGACVGIKGSRVQNIVQELKGEKIDIVQWDEDPVKFVCNSLSPVEINKVIVDENNRLMEVVVPRSVLYLAIGKGGQNVKLASMLTKWQIDISAPEEDQEEDLKAKDVEEKKDEATFENISKNVEDATIEKDEVTFENISKNIEDATIENDDESVDEPIEEKDDEASQEETKKTLEAENN